MKNYESIERSAEYTNNKNELIFKKTKNQQSTNVYRPAVYFAVLAIGIISSLYVILHKQTNNSLTEEKH
jgi:hypothetical protein